MTEPRDGERVNSTVPGRWQDRSGTVRFVGAWTYEIQWDDDGPRTLVVLGSPWAETVHRGMERIG